MYNFDLETEEGVQSLMELLPILDEKIVAEIYTGIWPTSSAKNKDPDFLKLQIQGLIHDRFSEPGPSEIE